MRRPSSRAREIALFVPLTVASGVAAFTGDPWGIVGLVFFGGGGTVYVALTRAPRSSSRSTMHGTLAGAQHHTAAPVGVVYAGSRGYAVTVTVGAAIFVAVGAYFLTVAVGVVSGQRSVVAPVLGLIFGLAGAAAVAFFGLCGVVGVWAAAGRRGGIALLPEGVYARMAGTAWVRWDDLASASVAGGSSHLALSARSRDAIVLTGLFRWLQGVNRRWFRADVAIPSQYLRVAPSTVVGAIRYYRQNPSARTRLADPAAANIEPLG